MTATSAIRNEKEFDAAVRAYGVDPTTHRWDDYKRIADNAVTGWPQGLPPWPKDALPDNWNDHDPRTIRARKHERKA